MVFLSVEKGELSGLSHYDKREIVVGAQQGVKEIRKICFRNQNDHFLGHVHLLLCPERKDSTSF